MSEVESINPNESTSEVPAGDKIELAGGSSPVSFDELENIHKHHSDKAKEEKKAARAEIKSKDEKTGDDGGAGKDVKKQIGEEKDGRTTETKATDKTVQAKENIKTIKAKLGDADLEMNLASLIPVKVQGQEQTVSLDELRNNYAGKVAWNNEFSKLGTQAQKFKQEREQLATRLKDIFETSRKDGLGALMKMAEFSGQNPLEWRTEFMKVLLPQLENYLYMDETEKAASEKSFEANYWKQQAESQSKAKHEEESFKSFEARVSTLQQTHKIDPETFSKTFYELEKLQKEGHLNKEITAEFVVDVVRTERVFDSVEDAFKEIELDLPEEQKKKILKDMIDLSEKNPDLKTSDLKEIVKEVWGQQKAKNLSRKIQKAGAPQAIKAKTQPKNPGQEPITFDDL
jgi:hypothetical protein